MPGHKTFFIFITLYHFIFAQLSFSQNKISILQVPGVNEYSNINPLWHSVLCSGRYITPAGKTITLTRAPFALKLSPDGKKAVVLHQTGVLTIIDLQNPDKNIRVPDYKGTIKSPLNDATFLGLAFSKDSKTLYLSGGDKGSVVFFDLKTLQKTDEINLNGIFNNINYEDSFTSDLTINYEKNELLVLDRANFRMVRIDISNKKITSSIKTGRIPFGISLSKDNQYCFVANVGFFEYPIVPGVTKTNKDSMMLSFPPYGFNTKESQDGVEIKGRKIPGVGSPLADEAMSVWMIDLHSDKIISKIKTGYQVGEMIEEAEVVGGASPNSIAVGNRFAYVTNATNDNISVIDIKTFKLKEEIKLTIDKRINKYRGIMPFGICLSKDEKTLYVACLGLNAVALINTATKKIMGYIPTGWGTTRVAVSDDDKKLFITAARGYGAGPNGGKGFIKPPQGTYIGDIQLGTFQIVEADKLFEKTENGLTGLQKMTEAVIQNTFSESKIIDDFKNPLPALPKLHKSPIKHIVYITKENRTYDEIFGQLKNAKGDSTRSRFGVDVTYTLPDSLKNRFPHLNVMPNHHKIARQFAFSDNFYCDSDASIHGHHWMVGTIPNEYVEANSAANSTYKVHSTAPGRRMPKTTGGVDPEDYNEIGGLWENMDRNKISFYNFGESNEFAGVEEEWNHTHFGAVFPVAEPLPKALFENTSRNYAGFNTNIPDQVRMEQFEEEFTKKWLSGKDTMPQLITMQLPNDHGADPRPADGYPYLHSFMADNDLALGRILHFLSRTKYWKSTLVIVTEDDPQGGVDHIDAHRSILMMAGPYIKKNYVSHTHANFGSILKVIYNITGAGYVNQYDATASLLQDFFTGQPDFTPYSLLESDKRIFDPQKALNKYKITFDLKKVKKGPSMDNENQQREDHYKQNPR